MEYPFKDLMPLDEATARDGYYKDWTHIDADTFHQISELAKFIREKGYGSDTREAIAQALERVYHDAAQSGNANMEVSQARGSYPSLGQRLNEADNKQRQTTEQLAQTIRLDESNLSLNNFNEHDRAVIQGLADGEINAVLGDKNVVNENLADGIITPGKLSEMYLEGNPLNLFDYTTVSKVDGYYTDGGTLTNIPPGYSSSDFIKVEAGARYYIGRDATPASGLTTTFYDGNGDYISSVYVEKSVVAPVGAKYMKIPVLKTRNKETWVVKSETDIIPEAPVAKHILSLDDNNSILKGTFRGKLDGSSIVNGSITKDKLWRDGLSEKWQTSTTVDDYSVDGDVVAIERNAMDFVWNGIWTTPSDFNTYTVTNLFGFTIIGYSDTAFLAFSGIDGLIYTLSRFDAMFETFDSPWSPVTPIIKDKEIKIDISGNIVTVFNADGSLYANLDLSTIEELESDLPNFHIGVLGGSWMAHDAYPVGTKLFKINTTSDDVLFNTSYDTDIKALKNQIDALTSSGSEGSHWGGKTWYAYGTSITSTAQGKYVPHLATLSGLNYVNKGIPGGGITNLGGYAKGEVKAAIMNTTDGKLSADLITLEVGANESGPVGDKFDLDDTTFCGCLNQAIRYLQENTNAQIVVMSSVATTTEPSLSKDYYERHVKIKEVCEINNVYYMSGDSGLGWARIKNNTVYTADNIHQTDLGGYNLAQYMWSNLKNIPLWYTAIS